MSGFTPVNQVRLTNVAYVRLNKNGKRFEIACYRNKVLSWRNKIETDIREVLQTDSIFVNVSKGMLASNKELLSSFGTTETLTVCSEILNKGELQVSEQERAALYETVFRDVASIVAEKTINPETNRSYTVSMIQNSMRQMQYSINISKSSKSQALDVIKKLRAVMPIARANMMVRICCLAKDTESILSHLREACAKVLSRNEVKSQALNEEMKCTSHMEVSIDPEHYRTLNDLLCGPAATYDSIRLEILQLRADSSAQQGSETFEHDVIGKGDSSLLLDVELQSSFAEEKKTGTEKKETITKKKEKKAKKKKVGDDDEEEEERAEEGAESSITRARRLLGITDRPSTARSIHEGDSKTKTKSRRRRGRTAKGAEDDHNILSGFIPMGPGDSDEEEEDDDCDALNVESIVTNSKAQLAAIHESDEEDEPPHHNTENKTFDIVSHVEEESGTVAIPDRVADNDDSYVLVSRVGIPPVTTLERQEVVDSNSDTDSDNDEAPSVVTLTASMKNKAVRSVVSEEKPKESCGKKGKRNKRIEKEESKLREAKAAELQARIESSRSVAMESKVSQISDTAITTSSSSSSSSSPFQSCNTCGGEYFDSQSYRNHFKSELHRVNLKRKMKNLPVFKSDDELLAAGTNELSLMS